MSILYPTSLANLVVEVGTSLSRQILYDTGKLNQAFIEEEIDHYLSWNTGILVLLLIPGIKEYIAHGIPADKLVFGLPWYGYIYRCLSLSPVST